MIASARTTIGQLSIGRKFATITTASGKRRLSAKLSAGLRRMKPTEKQLGRLMDDGVRAALDAKLVPVTVMLPEELVRVSQVVAESCGCDTVDQLLANHIHDLASASDLAVAGHRDEYGPAYAKLKR